MSPTTSGKADGQGSAYIVVGVAQAKRRRQAVCDVALQVISSRVLPPQRGSCVPRTQRSA
jgi:hypothetical protein